MTVKVIGPRDPRPPDAIDTTSRSNTWSRGLSPFFLGPIPLYKGAVVPESWTMENAWQYAKVYLQHVDEDQEPTEAYFQWARTGWESPRADRYPMGKGVTPLYSWWEGEKLTYLEARKKIYFPLYLHAVSRTQAFELLLEMYREKGEITLWDFDGYDFHALGMTFKDVLECSTRKMGHALVLAYLLERLR